MSRHSHNNTASSVFTYHERQNILDNGSLCERLGHDSLRRFEYCWLCLKPATGPPVANSTGHLFCKKCIVLNFEEQRKKWELEEKKRELEAISELNESEDTRQAIIDQAKFQTNQRLIAITNVETAPSVPDTLAGTLYIHSDEEEQAQDIAKREKKKQQQMTKRVLDVEEPKSVSFWAPHEMPLPLMPAKKPKIDSENKRFRTKCPITGKNLRLKDLITVHPKEEIDDNAPSKVRWICDVSDKDLSHHSVVLIKETGQLILEDVFKKLLVGTPINSKDNKKVYTMDSVVKMQSGETIFAAHNRVEGKIFRPAFR